MTARKRSYAWPNWTHFFKMYSFCYSWQQKELSTSFRLWEILGNLPNLEVFGTDQTSALWVLLRLSTVWCQSNLQTKTQLLTRGFFEFRLLKKVVAGESWKKFFFLLWARGTRDFARQSVFKSWPIKEFVMFFQMKNDLPNWLSQARERTFRRPSTF